MTIDLASQLKHTLANSGIVQEVVVREVPLLSADWGAKDEDALVHSLGICLLSGIGRALGYVAISEFPVPRAARWKQKPVRVDSAWIDRDSRQTVLLAEFERFSRDTALDKLANLCVASHGCDNVPEVLFLCLWSLDGTGVDASWLRTTEFSVPNGPPVSPAKNSTVVIYHAIFGRRADRLHFLRFRSL